MLIGVRQRGQPRLGCPFCWHTTHRSVDDRTAPARCVYHAMSRDTARRSQQLRQLIQSLAYRRRHHSDCHPGPRCRHQTMSCYTALMCLPVCCSWLAVWLSGDALASINVVALRQTRLVLGWVTVYGRVNHLGV